MNVAPRRRRPYSPHVIHDKYQVTIPGYAGIHRNNAHLNDDAPTLPPTFQSTDQDIVCGRGKGSYNAPGNVRFRNMVKQHIPDYQASKTKMDKSLMIGRILDHVKALNLRFVGRKNGRWIVIISEEHAREKIGHSMREAIAAQHRKSRSLELKQQQDPANGNHHQTMLLQQKAMFESMVAQLEL